MQDSHRKCTRVEKISKKLGDPDASRCTLAGAMGQGVINKNRTGKILVENYDGDPRHKFAIRGHC